MNNQQEFWEWIGGLVQMIEENNMNDDEIKNKLDEIRKSQRDVVVILILIAIGVWCNATASILRMIL